MFILSSITSDLECWSVSHTSISANPELNIFKKVKLVDKISDNKPSSLFGTNVCKTLDFSR